MLAAIAEDMPSRRAARKVAVSSAPTNSPTSPTARARHAVNGKAACQSDLDHPPHNQRVECRPLRSARRDSTTDTAPMSIGSSQRSRQPRVTQHQERPRTRQLTTGVDALPGHRLALLIRIATTAQAKPEQAHAHDQQRHADGPCRTSSIACPEAT